MSMIIEEYDRAIHETPARSVQMAQRLLAVVRRDIASGQVSREEVRARLEQLYNLYEEREQADELEAVADVLDSFYGWAPLKAEI